MTAHPAIVWTDPERRLAFEQWLQGLLALHALDPHSLRAASADASFRRYFRIDRRGVGGTEVQTCIVMDAPPQHGDCRAFLRMAAWLRGGGLRVPHVFACDEGRGFLLLEDLGESTLLDALRGLDATRAAPLYRAAFDSLITLQSITPPADLTVYDEAFMRRELDLFVPWYAECHCGVTLDADERARLALCEQLIVGACLAQPRVLMHRDYHSRNLMQPAEAGDAPGVIDFQDAVIGPVTYDPVSLLRDAYVEWDEETQLDWAIRYWERARRAGVPVHDDFGDFWRAFEWMGLQRHLKVLGIFARLHHRDGKSGYLADIPRVWRHAHHVAVRYRGLGPLALLLERLAGTQRESGYTF